MNQVLYIGVTANILWAITLLFILRTVRLQNYDLVGTAVEGNAWLGWGWISIPKFLQIYKTYYKIKGYNFLLIINIASFLIALVSVCFLIAVSP